MQFCEQCKGVGSCELLVAQKDEQEMFDNQATTGEIQQTRATESHQEFKDTLHDVARYRNCPNQSDF